MMRLRQMSVFAHIVETGSITATAELLDVSKSVVSQHLKSLENELEILLLKRTTRKQSLTDAGQRFYQQCKMINQIANDAWLDVQQTKIIPQGRIRITAPSALMETLVAPSIGRLLLQYPLLMPELISHDQHLDLMNEDIDLAIRVGQSQESALKQKRIGTFRDVLCGKPDYIHSKPWQELAYISNTWQGKEIHHRFKAIAADKITPELKSSSMIQQSNTPHSSENISYKTTAHCVTNSFHTCLALIQSSSGIGIIPDFHLKTLSTELSDVFPDHRLPANSVYALHAFGKQMPLSVEVCLGAIEEQLTIAMAT
ncbi:LysR family transcriptional regulator [Psychromonas sp. Urea-02u-13]|uniref:LysR family transcriptional regulator n=1 Tax=Psychromonas sp. Urea-02u-13 TaxID=2058326 RepID=UPI000C327B35|nr:LysR family transcriptional regulator [Psychromonas sp. Urea-02u-13]PKG37208.1 transcriptional regulator [Psychromonas sp. Urea-02u-13]